MTTLALLIAMSISGQTADDVPLRYTAAEAQALFNEASEAYAKEDFATAQARYEQLVKAGFGSPAVLFNLGTTHLAAGQLGPAILYLERAHRQSGDEDIAANLAVAREKQGDQVVGADEAAEPFLQRLAGALDIQLVSLGFLVTWYLGFALAFIAWRKVSLRWALGIAASVLLIIGAVLGSFVAVHAYVQRTVVEGIVMPETVKVRELPGERARVAFEVHAGLKVRIMEQTGKFVRIRLPNALEGWADKEGLVEL